MINLACKKLGRPYPQKSDESLQLARICCIVICERSHVICRAISTATEQSARRGSTFTLWGLAPYYVDRTPAHLRKRRGRVPVLGRFPGGAHIATAFTFTRQSSYGPLWRHALWLLQHTRIVANIFHIPEMKPLRGVEQRNVRAKNLSVLDCRLLTQYSLVRKLRWRQCQYYVMQVFQ